MVHRCTKFDTKPRLNHRYKGIAKSHRLVGHNFPTRDSNLALEIFSVLELWYVLPPGPIRPRIQPAE